MGPEAGETYRASAAVSKSRGVHRILAGLAARVDWIPAFGAHSQRG